MAGNPMGSFKDLKNRYINFKTEYFEENDTYKTLLEQGQKPHSLVISCSDSRVDPALIFNAQPGELFVVRNIANWVPAYHKDQQACSIASALAFGVIHLKVQHIIVLGHSHCAGVKTLSDASGIAKPILNWTSTITYDKASSHNMVQKVLIDAYHNLMTYPWIDEQVKAHALECHAWCFCIDSGNLDVYNPQSDSFTTVHNETS